MQTLINALNSVRLPGGEPPGLAYPARLVNLLNWGVEGKKLPEGAGHACVQAHGADFVLLASSAAGLQALLDMAARFSADFGPPLDCRAGETQVSSNAGCMWRIVKTLLPAP